MAAADSLAQSDRQAIIDILHRYFWLIDHGHADQVAGCFTENARLTFGPGAPSPGTIEGRDIAAAMLARAKQVQVTTRHVLSNIALTVTGDSRVQAYSLLTLFRSENTTRDTYPAAVADIDDVLVRTDSGWLIQDRTISPIFNRA